MRGFRRLTLLCLASMLVSIGALADSSSDSTDPELQREGKRIQNLEGEFRETGRRWLLVVHGGANYQILENLALQRAVQAIRDDAGDRYWTISGELTEFFGENYLIVQRLSRTPRRATTEVRR